MKNRPNDPIPIAVAFTPNYVVPAATTLQSLLRSSSQWDIFHVFVLLQESLPHSLQEKLRRLAPTRMIFTFVEVNQNLDNLYIDPRYTIAASYRLLLPQLLPQVDKILYIDCDIIVRHNAAQLYRSTSLQNNYLAGVYEAVLDFQKPYLRRLGLDADRYINSGFLLMNLHQMRQDNIVPWLLEEAQKPGWQFPDQDVLNKVCSGRILPLDPICNGIRTFFLPQYQSEFLQRYTPQQWTNVQKQGNVHYTGGKPWRIASVKFPLWWKTYRTLPKEIRSEWRASKKLYWLALLCQVTQLDAILRKIKNSLVRKK